MSSVYHIIRDFLRKKRRRLHIRYNECGQEISYLVCYGKARLFIFEGSSDIAFEPP